MNSAHKHLLAGALVASFLFGLLVAPTRTVKVQIGGHIAAVGPAPLPKGTYCVYAGVPVAIGSTAPNGQICAAGQPVFLPPGETQ